MSSNSREKFSRLTKASFEVQFGIMAACFPTLPPGYKWLRKRLDSRKDPSTGHLPLADNPAFTPARDTKTTKPSQAHHTHINLSKSLFSETQLGDDASNQIRKTVSIDVERKSREDLASHHGQSCLRRQFRLLEFGNFSSFADHNISDKATLHPQK